MKYIKIYNRDQYTKTGKMKKKAKTEFGITIVGSDTPKEDNEYIARRIKACGYHSFTSPYFFTHIDALNEKGERVLICESVVIGSDNREVCTTPETLYKLLIKN